MSTLRPEPLKPRTTPFAKPEGVAPSSINKDLTEAEAEAITTIIGHFEKEVLTEDEKFWLTKECALRYYRASKLNIHHAISRIKKTLAWRKEFNVSSITPEEIEKEAETGKQVLLGFDNERRPILFLYPSRQNTPVSLTQLKFVVWTLERCIELMPIGVDNLVLCVNYKSTASATIPGISQSKEFLHILQNHYVERLAKSIIINCTLVSDCSLTFLVPWFVTVFFKIISPFIDAQTRQRMVFNENPREYIPPHQLDSEFDGDLQFEYVHSEYWPHFLKVTQFRTEGMRRRWREHGSCVGTSELVLKDGLEEEVDLKLQDEVSDLSLSEAINGHEKRVEAESNGPDSVDCKSFKNSILVSLNGELIPTTQAENRDIGVLKSALSDTASFVTARE